MSKYAVKNTITRDSFNYTIDGKPDGPGPAHYSSLRKAFLGAGAWLWLYAEASRRRHGPGHSREWDTVIFRNGGKYGFLTPESHGEQHAGGPSQYVKRHPRAAPLQREGYMHSHPRGARAMGLAGNILSGIVTDPDGGLSGDLGVAMQHPTTWIGVLTPVGSIVRARLDPDVIKELGNQFQFGPAMKMTRQLRKVIRKHRRGLFVQKTDQPRRGRRWAPGTESWREECLSAIAREMGYAR